MVEIKLVENLSIQEVSVTSSLGNVGFDYDQFWDIQCQLNRKPDGSFILTDQNRQLSFGKGDVHTYWLFALNNLGDSTYRGVAYIKTHNLGDAPILAEKQIGDYVITRFGDEAANKLKTTEVNTRYVIEYGGIVVPTVYQHRGYANKLFEYMVQQVHETILHHKVSLIDRDSSTQVEPEQILNLLVAKGELEDDQNWRKLKVISQSSQLPVGVNLEELGIDNQAVGKPREQSVASQVIAQRNSMNYIGITLSNGGPIYGKRLSVII